MKMDLALNNLQRLICPKIQTANNIFSMLSSPISPSLLAINNVYVISQKYRLMLRLLICFAPCVFSCQHCLGDLHWSLSDSKSFMISRIIHSILTNISNGVLLIAFCFFHWFPLHHVHFSKPLGTVPSVPTTLCINTTHLFNSSEFPTNVWVFCIFSLAFIFTRGSTGKIKGVSLWCNG